MFFFFNILFLLLFLLIFSYSYCWIINSNFSWTNNCNGLHLLKKNYGNFMKKTFFVVVEKKKLFFLFYVLIGLILDVFCSVFSSFWLIIIISIWQMGKKKGKGLKRWKKNKNKRRNYKMTIELVFCWILFVIIFTVIL